MRQQSRRHMEREAHSTSDMMSVARVVLNSFVISLAGPSPNATLSAFHLLRTIVAISRSSELTLNTSCCAPSLRPVMSVLPERFGVLIRYCAFPSGVRSALLYASSLSKVKTMGAGRGLITGSTNAMVCDLAGMIRVGAVFDEDRELMLGSFLMEDCL